MSRTLTVTNYRRHWRLSNWRLARKEGVAHPHGSPQGSLRVPVGRSEADMDHEKWASEGGCRISKPVQWSASPPWVDVDVSHLLSMLMVGFKMVPQNITSLVVMPLLGRLWCLLSSGTMRSSASRTTNERQWCGRVSSSC